MGRTIDHLVYSVPDLDRACEEVAALLGVRPKAGGYHPTKGTQNAVLKLGDGCYLELLAVDPANTAISPPRWMGIDLITQACMTRWALKSSDLAQDSAWLNQHDSRMGVIEGGQRRTKDGSMLSWKMVLPLPSPAVEILPFMVDWQQSEVHPSTQLSDGCQLIRLEFYHPKPQELQAIFEALDIDYKIIAADEARISAVIDSPNGRCKLG